MFRNPVLTAWNGRELTIRLYYSVSVTSHDCGWKVRVPAVDARLPTSSELPWRGDPRGVTHQASQTANQLRSSADPPQWTSANSK